MGMSQDEIERLKSEEEGGAEEAPKPSAKHTAVLERMAELLSESVQNIVPILVGAEKASVTPDVPESGNLGELLERLPEDGVYFTFPETPLADKGFVGVLDLPLALTVSQKMMGQEGAEELNDALSSALNEALGNVLGAFDTSMSEEFGEAVEHGDIKFLEGNRIETVPGETGLELGSPAGLVTLSVSLDDAGGKLGLLLIGEALEQVYSKHPSSKEEEPPEEEAAAPAPEEPEVEAPAPEPAAPAAAEEAKPAVEEPSPAEVQRAGFEELTPRQPAGETKGVELILDVPLGIAVELGRKTLSVREIMQLVPGSLVELDKLAGETVDLLVNGKLFAKGEVVTIDENFGVRVSTILTPKERLERLR